ncbi:MBL fold metallo-hydrolase [Nostoc sp. UHCC 0702]|nr:MBL fold metallo-hydrolase [Nostoc sp. UHCC 0702]
MAVLFLMTVLLTVLGSPGGIPGKAIANVTTQRTFPDPELDPPVPANLGYLVKQIGDRVYWVTDGVYNAMFIVTRAGVIVVDAPAFLGDNLTKAIRDVTQKPVRWVIYSHAHSDHIGTANQFAGATIIAHQDTLTELRRINDPRRPLPTVTFDRQYTLHAGEKIVQLDYKGPNHEPGNIFIWLPQDRVLMMVDIIWARVNIFKNLSQSVDIPGFIEAHDEILRYPFKVLVTGHLGLAEPQDVVVQRELVGDIIRGAAQALQDIQVSTIAQQLGSNDPVKITDSYFNELSNQCANQVLAKWSDRLYGMQYWTKDHCYTMVQSLRFDYNFFGGPILPAIQREYP